MGPVQSVLPRPACMHSSCALASSFAKMIPGYSPLLYVTTHQLPAISFWLQSISWGTLWGSLRGLSEMVGRGFAWRRIDNIKGVQFQKNWSVGTSSGSEPVLDSHPYCWQSCSRLRQSVAGGKRCCPWHPLLTHHLYEIQQIIQDRADPPNQFIYPCPCCYLSSRM